MDFSFKTHAKFTILHQLSKRKAGKYNLVGNKFLIFSRLKNGVCFIAVQKLVLLDKLTIIVPKKHLSIAYVC